jgi:hypothetical protein
VHVVVLCDLVMIKIRNLVYSHFHEKAFTKVCYLERGGLDFKGNVLGFWILKRQTFESWPHIWHGCAYFQSKYIITAFELIDSRST